MGNTQITPKEIKKMMEFPGRVRGQVFLTDYRYIKERKGEEGVELLKKKIKEWGVPLNYEKAKPLDWYPVGFRAISLLAIKEIFNWGDKEIFELGNNAPKFSFIVKLLMKYFLSPQRSFLESPKYWSKHYSVGKLEACEFNEKKKFLIIRLKDFKVHPVFCPLLRGYFLRIAQFVLKSKKVTIKETKCVFKKDSYCEFVIKWE